MKFLKLLKTLMFKLYQISLKLLLLLYLLVFHILLYGQSNKSLSFKDADFFIVDNLNNYYIIENNGLCKYTQEWKKIGCRQFGINAKPLIIDVSNPYKVLAYSQSQQQLYFLNNQLTDLAVINTDIISDKTYRFKICCVSENAYFWAYDEIADKLLLFDVHLKIIRESNSLYQQTGFNILPSELKETNDYLIVANPEEGVFVFDLFGNYIYKIPYLYYKNVQVENNKVYCYYAEMFKVWDVRIRNERQYPLSKPNLKYVNIMNNLVYYIDSCGLPGIINLN